MEELFSRRIQRCQDLMEEAGVDLLALDPGPNMRYLSGVEASKGDRHFLMFLPRRGDPVFLIPEVESEKVDNNLAVLWSDEEDPLDYLEQITEGIVSEPGKVLIDDRMWERFSQDVRAVLPDSEFGIAGEILASMRAVKGEKELDSIREASEIADLTIRDVRSLGKEAVGMTEKDLKDFIEQKLDEHGGEGTSFEPVVASGPNGAEPHHRGSDSVIQPGDPVVLDLGCLKNGYPSDLTRTIVFQDEPSEEFLEVYETVREAQESGIEKVEPGVRTDEVDEVVRSMIEEAGYGDEFTHRTGHGVGLEIHEHPKLPEVGREQMELEPGMVFTIEPGIYIEGKFGVRIEDLVLVIEDGCERLNSADRGWKV